MTGTFPFRNHSAAWKSWAFRPWGQLQLFKMYVDNVQRIYAVGMRCDDLGGRFYCWFSIFFCFDHGDHGSTQILVAISDPNFRHKQNTWKELAWQHSRLARNHPLQYPNVFISQPAHCVEHPADTIDSSWRSQNHTSLRSWFGSGQTLFCRLGGSRNLAQRSGWELLCQ